MKNYTHLFPVVMALLFLHSVARSQTCPSGNTFISTYTNTYYPGSQATVAAGATSVTVGASGYGSTPISQYDIVLIIQMQGAQINSANTANYGAGTGTGSGYLNNAQLMAGKMEYAIAANNVPLVGGTLTLQTGLTNSYKNANFATDGQYRYQVIRVPLYYNLTLSADILPPIWNGAVGGVIVLYVSNILNMNSHKIDASSAGFRGGGGVAISNAGSTGSNNDYVEISSAAAGKSGGSKGEGIAGTPLNLFALGATSLISSGVEGYPNGTYDRGAPGNAGGGATDGQPSSNSNNAGGGGGANGGAGGIGGNSWSSNLAVGGKPGTQFAQQSTTRLVMGGGGGAGSTDGGTGTPGSGFASSGAPGGGIVMITASSITGSGSVLANGAPPNTTILNDGAGGGGGGGSVLIVTGIASPTLTVQANGSDGASNTGNGAKHGPGGGGGGGIIYSNKALGSVSVAGGAAGNTTILTTPTTYGAAPGTAGISAQTITTFPAPPVICNGLLAIESISATASSTNGNVDIVWQTISQTAALQYDVERSPDNSNFSTIATILPQTDNNEYHYKDVTGDVSNTRYYRIREKDINDTWLYSNVVAIRPTLSFSQPTITPNPASSSAILRFTSDRSSAVTIRLIDPTGAPVWNRQFKASEGPNTVSIDQLQHLPTGMYILQLNDGEKLSAMKMFIRH